MKREVYLSLARVISALAVVMIHTNVCFSEFNIEHCWALGNFIHCSLSFAVPVFLMISGATLMNYHKRYTTGEYFRRRFRKTVVPYVVWSFFGVVICPKLDIIGMHLIYVFFLYLFGIYLCIPVFSLLREEYQDQIIAYVVGVSFLLNYLIPFLYKIFPSHYVIQIPFDIANGFLIYALLGYLIAKYDISWKWRMLSYGMALLGFALRIGGTYINSMQMGMIDHTFRGYTNITTLLSAVGVFVFIKQIGQKIKNEVFIKVIEWLSSYTFSIFLIHYYILKLIKVYVFSEYIHTFGYKLIIPIIVFGICIGIIEVLRKIRIIDKLLP